MPQPKDKDWLNGYKNKTPTYVVYKRPTSKQGIPKPPVDSQLGFLVFIEGTQVQFLGRELRVHFKPPLTAVSKITSVSE